MFWDLFVNAGIIFNTIAYPVQLVIADETTSQKIFVAIDIIYIADLIFRLFVFRERYGKQTLPNSKKPYPLFLILKLMKSHIDQLKYIDNI